MSIGRTEWRAGASKDMMRFHDYWTRQWGIINPHVEPLQIEPDEDGRMVVEVRQVIRDLEGKVIGDSIVHHAYRFRDGLIERMDIE